MQTESQLAAFVRGFDARDLPTEAACITRRVVLAAVGTGIAGAAEDGIGPLRDLLLSRGGTAQARALVFGDRLPAAAAAQLNGTMCRALDYCDAMGPASTSARRSCRPRSRRPSWPAAAAAPSC